jgi:hypothetical protein
MDTLVAFGAGDYRAGWYLFDDDAIELDDPMEWEPIMHDWFENDTLPHAYLPGASPDPWAVLKMF